MTDKELRKALRKLTRETAKPLWQQSGCISDEEVDAIGEALAARGVIPDMEAICPSPHRLRRR